MNGMTEKEISFIENFSILDSSLYALPDKIDLPIFDKFLTNDIGVNYMGSIIKDINIRLYLAYLKMIDENIKFIDDYDIEKSVCISEVAFGVIRDVKINVPNIRSGIDIMATMHELGHGLKSYTKIKNERHLHSNTMFDETISILLGKVCLDRYISDFGYDKYVEQFELLNISNAINCLEKIKTILPEYIRKQTALDLENARIIKNPKRDDYKYRSFVREVEKLRNQLYTLISYPIGIALANVYDNFDKDTKDEYLKFISEYLLNIKHIEFSMILEYFNINFDVRFYIKNFNEYINKFEKLSNRGIGLRRKK